MKKPLDNNTVQFDKIKLNTGKALFRDFMPSINKTRVYKEINYDQLDSKLENIYQNLNVDQYLNLKDISGTINGLQHNRSNLFNDSDIRGIEILQLKLLIEDGNLSPDFEKSLKLSIIYDSLKSKKDELGVQDLLQYIANKTDQNLFIIECLSSAEQRSNDGHAIGRVITRPPEGISDKALVSVCINKGTKAPSRSSHQYSFESISEQSTLKQLRYPLLDAHENASQLQGRKQVVGNCANIALKEALQVAKAFENKDFKSDFFKTSTQTSKFVTKSLAPIFKTFEPFDKNIQQLKNKLPQLLKKRPSADSYKQSSFAKKLRKSFKSHYLMDGLRTQDKLSYLLINAFNNSAPQKSKNHCHEVTLLQEIHQSRFESKKHRHTSEDTINSRTFVTDSGDGGKLPDIKTFLSSNKSAAHYFGLDKQTQSNPAILQKTLKSLWESKQVSSDQKLNYTLLMAEEILSTTTNSFEKSALIIGLLELNQFHLDNNDNEKTVKTELRSLALDNFKQLISQEPVYIEILAQGLSEPNIIQPAIQRLVAAGETDLVAKVLGSILFAHDKTPNLPTSPHNQPPQDLNQANTTQVKQLFLKNIVQDTALIKDIVKTLHGKNLTPADRILWSLLANQFIETHEKLMGTTNQQEHENFKSAWNDIRSSNILINFQFDSTGLK